MTNLMAKIGGWKFGVEIEMGGASYGIRTILANVTARVLRSHNLLTPAPAGSPEPTTTMAPPADGRGPVRDAAVSVATSGYDNHVVVDTQGRKWSHMTDGSISCGLGNCEFVTPPLTQTDMPLLQDLIRAHRDAGAKANASCGIHVHVDAAPLTPVALRNLVRMTFRVEPILHKALRVQRARTHGGNGRPAYCRPLPQETVDRFARVGEQNAAARAWYGVSNDVSARSRASVHYDDSRYHGLNLHAVFSHGTVEFRYFEAFADAAANPTGTGTVHAGKVRAYVLLALALASKARDARTMSAAREIPATVEKYHVNQLLNSLGCHGDDFAVVRKHLMDHLPGFAAFRGGIPSLGWLQRNAPGRIPQFYLDDGTVRPDVGVHATATPAPTPH